MPVLLWLARCCWPFKTVVPKRCPEFPSSFLWSSTASYSTPALIICEVQSCFMAGFVTFVSFSTQFLMSRLVVFHVLLSSFSLRPGERSCHLPVALTSNLHWKQLYVRTSICCLSLCQLKQMSLENDVVKLVWLPCVQMLWEKDTQVLPKEIFLCYTNTYLYTGGL